MLSRLANLFSITSRTVDPSLFKSAMSTTSEVAPEIATFASGCFWGVEHIFLKQFPPAQNKGILSTRVGYTGGATDSKDPSYREVCSGNTGHAEALRIEFDPKVLSYEELLKFLYSTHDSTTLDRQGPDRGTQYRSAIFYNTPEQREVAERVTSEIQEKYVSKGVNGFEGKKIATKILPAGPWYDAEEYHQLYLFKNPSGYQCPTHRLWW